MRRRSNATSRRCDGRRAQTRVNEEFWSGFNQSSSSGEGEAGAATAVGGIPVTAETWVIAGGPGKCPVVRPSCCKASKGARKSGAWATPTRSPGLRPAVPVRGRTCRPEATKCSTCSLTVSACVVPPLVLRHVVLLGRDSWMRFTTRFYRSLPPQPPDNQVLGEPTLSHHASTGLSACTIDPIASGGGFHLRYDGTVGVALSDEPQLLAVNLVRSSQ